ncbi:MAG: helix-turn-helix domain-containing protein [Clostridiales bacterium]|nr:helix-turn-helix domain-containing protein [Clostridiales bacterium]
MIKIFKDVLKKLRKDARLSQNQLAEKLGLAPSTIGNYEQGTRIPDYETLELIADFFNVNMDVLFNRNEYIARLLPPEVTDDVVEIPVLGEIAAGYNELAVEDWTGETVKIPTDYLHGRKKEEFFVLTVHGDSMYPLYMEGDKVLILRQETLNHSGEIGAVLYDGELATLKRVEYVAGEDWMKMIPVNPNYPPKTIAGADLEKCRILGIPKLVVREVK